MFSLLMSIYKKDEPAFLEEALLSILTQEYLPSEIIIVFDGPVTPEINTIIEIYKVRFLLIDIPFIEVKLQKNRGLGLALREGVKYCSKKYIVRMDSDDISRTDRLLITKKYILENPGYSVYGGQIEEFNIIPNDLNRRRNVPLHHDELCLYAKKRNPMNHVTVCIDRDAICDVNNYESIIFHEDYFLWIKFISKGYKIVNIDKVLVDVRVGNDLIGRRKGFYYLKYEVLFVRKCMRYKFFNFIDSIKYLFPRAFIRFSPDFIINKIYKKLRN